MTNRAVSDASEGDPWMDRMRRGDFEAAWKICDDVMRGRAGTPCWHLPRHQQYIWDGRPLNGQRVLVRCYHGLGDTILFIRYAPLIKAIAREVIVWAQPALLPLLRTVQGIDRLLPLHDGTPEADYDVDVEVMELPHVFRTAVETIPAAVPYLHVPAASQSGDVLNVGLTWQVSDWGNERSVPVELLEPLFTVTGIRLHVLQRGSALATWPAGVGVLSGSDDIWDAARVMRGLDLVLTVDSFPAHLAGALAVPVWIMLQHEADWRWMIGRDDSPWYPTARLFRQPRAGDWPAVIARVAQELRALRNRTAIGLNGSPHRDEHAPTTSAASAATSH